jgi:hypothetical protein
MSIISGKVLNGMDNACKFAQGKARQNASRISRRGQEDIVYKVVPKGKDVYGYVGFKQQGDAFFLWFFEMGASNRRTRKGAYRGSIAQRPWLRPAVFDHKAEIVKLIASG